MKFEENLRELRKQSGFSQEELAERLQVSRQAVSKWENGSGYPELDKLMTLCDLFRCSLDELLKGDVSQRDMMNVQTYENHCNMMSKAMAFGIFMLLSSVTSGAFLETYLTGEKEAALGIIFFIFVTVGVLTFVYYGMQAESFHKRYPNVPQNIYSEIEQNEFEKKHRASTVIGVGMLLLSPAIQQLLDFISTESIANGVFMVIVSLAITNFVYFGSLKSKYDNTIPKTEAELAKEKADDNVGKWCGCIMIVAVMLYLLWSFLFDAWRISWIIFAIGGMMCGIVSIILKKAE